MALPVRAYHHLGLGPEDALLASYPKSGNTWVRFMLGHLIAGTERTWDDLGDVVPMVGRHRSALTHDEMGGRLVKTHDRLLSRYATPGDRRVVYLVRDGRDVAVSYFFHQQRVGTFEGRFGQFLETFLRTGVDRFGRWDEHLQSWLHSPRTQRVRLHLVRYEEMVADPVTHLSQIAGHLGLTSSEERIAEVVAAATPDRLRAKEGDSAYLAQQNVRDVPFVGAARAGGWRDHLTPFEAERFWDAAGDTLSWLGYAK